jgi:hypothetical protein
VTIRVPYFVAVILETVLIAIPTNEPEERFRYSPKRKRSKLVNSSNHNGRTTPVYFDVGGDYWNADSITEIRI